MEQETLEKQYFNIMGDLYLVKSEKGMKSLLLNQCGIANSRDFPQEYPSVVNLSSRSYSVHVHVMPANQMTKLINKELQ